jgi:hypothetical protein
MDARGERSGGDRARDDSGMSWYGAKLAAMVSLGGGWRRPAMLRVVFFLQELRALLSWGGAGGVEGLHMGLLAHRKVQPVRDAGQGSSWGSRQGILG